jgi:hypothetical protein
MAAGFTPTFGPDQGQYCADECKHSDCAESRALVAEACVTCHKPIGEQPRYFTVPGGGHEHQLCAYARIEDRQAMSS